jgi:hypothetical protein
MVRASSMPVSWNRSSSPHFDKVEGLRAGLEGEIEPLIGWYRENRVKVRFEIPPRAEDGNLGRELVRLGFYPSEFHIPYPGCHPWAACETQH